MYRNYRNDPRSGVSLESLAVVAQATVLEREAQGSVGRAIKGNPTEPLPKLFRGIWKLLK